ncbi:unnamed protein product [Ambrosiozyma monospora]|uniref:Unnamed protein product n=1 Tax=Ambrosiozyma monospora TaxID=43982 RepID=A0ACB5T8D4_AMBMO|nr:unnamed protein product [Ambrosiozyma monospora]
MIGGWLILALCVWGLFHNIGFTFSDSLLVGATFVATDPVLAGAIVGKSKFAERIRPDIKDLIQSESGCNDGMAFPFVTLSINLVLNRPNNEYAGEIVKDWILIGILYQCLLGTLFGACIGYVGMKGVILVKEKKWIDTESYLVFYIALSLICTGVGSVLGCDDLLLSFSAGCAFNWTGYFSNMGLVDSASVVGSFHDEEYHQAKTSKSTVSLRKINTNDLKEVHVSGIIDLLLNTYYFMYLGSIIPWTKFSLYPGRLVVLGFCFLLIARIPIVMMLQPIVPDLRSWKDALFVGHFGPRGVGSVFCCLLSKSMIKHKAKNFTDHQILYDNIWNITTFIVIVSVLVHGFSITAFTFYNTAKKIPVKVERSFSSQSRKARQNETTVEMQTVDPSTTSPHSHAKSKTVVHIGQTTFSKR